MRNDGGCGSTIGPMMSAKLGIRTVDIGTPTQHALHQGDVLHQRSEAGMLTVQGNGGVVCGDISIVVYLHYLN